MAFIVLATLLTITVTSCSETVEVIAKNFEFVPKEVTIKAGDTVKWIIEGTYHSSTSGPDCNPDGKWDSGILVSGDMFTREFKETGTYPYFCIPHCENQNMKGVIQVSPVK